MGIQLEPIGIVRSKGENTAEIEIYPVFLPGLKGIDEGNDLWVLYWMHMLSDSDREILEVHPRGDKSRAKRGVFAVRSPMRPNPIGLTRVSVLELDNNILTVSGLDAFEGSPIIDIKSG